MTRPAEWGNGMKKRFMILLALVLALLSSAATAGTAGKVILDEEHFPDPDFRNCISRQTMLREGSVLDKAQLASVENILLDGTEVTDLTGIGYFPNLKHIEIRKCKKLTALDLSGCRKLESLVAYDCSFLASLTVSDNPKLKTIDVQRCRLTELILGDMKSLESLYCNENRLTALDVSRCPKLKDLLCYQNSLAELDPGRNQALERLSCYGNDLTVLNLPKNPKLEYLNAAANGRHFNGETEIGLLDLSSCVKLKTLLCYDTRIGNLVLGSKPELSEVNVLSGRFSPLDISGCPILSRLVDGTGFRTTATTESGWWNGTASLYIEKDREVVTATRTVRGDMDE